MNIILLGTGVAIPQLERAQSGILVKTPEELVLFDCGAGILGRIIQSGYDYLKITSVFFTHHHLDHNSDFLALLKAQQLASEDLGIKRQKVRIYGPEGTNHWLDTLLSSYEYIDADVDVKELYDNDVIRVGSSVVTVRKSIHSVPSIAYRMKTPTSTFVYSGDTEPSEAIKELCHGNVDVLVHECSFPDEFSYVTNHTTPAKLRDLLYERDIERLVLTHLYPHTIGHENAMIETIKEKFKGRVDIGYDLMKIFL
jgi:ribonuclease BN (tRNA processing enzyme)